MDINTLTFILLSLSPQQQNVKVSILIGFFALAIVFFSIFMFIFKYMNKKQKLEKIYSSKMAKTEKALIETQQEISTHVLNEMGQELKRDVLNPVAAMKLKIELEEIKPKDEQKFDWIPKELNEYLEVIINSSMYLSKRPFLLNGFIYEIKLDVLRLEVKKGLKINYEYEDSLFEKTPTLGLFVFRLYQVLMSNVIKHSKADSVDISIMEEDAFVVFSFSDNGKGFNPKILKNMPDHSLNLIFERIRLVGGDIQFDSIPKNGTLCFAKIPLS